MSLDKAPVVNRNGVDLTLTSTVFGKKSKNNAGKPFFFPNPNINDTNFVTWMGEDVIVDYLRRDLRRDFADIYLDNIDEKTGILNEEKYLLECKNFDQGRVGLQALQDEVDRLTDINSAIYDKMLELDTDSPEYAAAVEEMKTNQGLIKPYRQKIAAISAEYKERAAKRKAEEAAEASQPEAVAA